MADQSHLQITHSSSAASMTLKTRSTFVSDGPAVEEYSQKIRGNADARHGPWRGVAGSCPRSSAASIPASDPSRAREDVSWRQIPRNVTVQPSTMFTGGGGGINKMQHTSSYRVA